MRDPLKTNPDSFHSGSYPVAVKSLAHSSGVYAAIASPTAAYRVATVRAAALRRIDFSFENAFSIGLKSGEYGES